MATDTAEPEAPTSRGIPGYGWRLAARRALHGFVRHRGIDSAAALTFYSVLAFFPATLVVVSVFALVRGKDNAADDILALVSEVAQPATVEAIEGPLSELFTVTNPGIALAIGSVLALWTMSGFATAFGRAVNTVYDVHEGRQIWKFRGLMLVLALFLLTMFGALIATLLATPNGVAAAGVPEPWLTTWNILRYPLALLLAGLILAVLYYWTPNVRHERFRWVSYGALFAIIVWFLATAGFWLYVSLVGQYDRVYGWLGGAIVLLLWLYLSNLVLVLGAEVDAEIVRLRQLGDGQEAEAVVQLPMRDTTRNLMLAKQLAQDEADSRALRVDAAAQRNPL
ncbi:MAG: YihY/virulence factor BrkB family protein [Actinomycetota bacterium]|nr:YihY/virulence factor BrkB family protein [Actinomycetota bacterium]